MKGIDLINLILKLNARAACTTLCLTEESCFGRVVQPAIDSKDLNFTLAADGIYQGFRIPCSLDDLKVEIGSSFIDVPNENGVWRLRFHENSSDYHRLREAYATGEEEMDRLESWHAWDSDGVYDAALVAGWDKLEAIKSELESEVEGIKYLDPSLP